MDMFDSIMVIHFMDGRVLKGFGSIISPGEAVMEFKDLEEKIHWVDLKTIKGAFYVRSFESTHHKSRPTLGGWTASHGQKVRVTFKDGEILEGLVNDVTRLAQAGGFYVVPIDPSSNNYRMWLNREAILKVHHVLNLIEEKRIL
jgi:hypothetical protein